MQALKFDVWIRRGRNFCFAWRRSYIDGGGDFCFGSISLKNPSLAAAIGVGGGLPAGRNGGRSPHVATIRERQDASDTEICVGDFARDQPVLRVEVPVQKCSRRLEFPQSRPSSRRASTA
jgi:hypothetical protein